MRGSSGGGSRYNDSAIKARISKVEDAIKLAKSFDTFMLKQKDGWSYDPQLPFYIRRKNERFEYLFLDLMVTD